MAPSWLLLLVISFSVFQFSHGHGRNDGSQLDALWQEVNTLKRTSAHHTACVRGIRFPRKCIVVSEQSKCFSEANDDCVAQGGTLVIPQNLAENNALKDNARCSAPECQDFWIGITDIVKEGCFKDVNGNSVSFFNWASGQGSSQNEDCVTLSTQGKWRDKACSLQKRYFCEFLISQCGSPLP